MRSIYGAVIISFLFSLSNAWAQVGDNTALNLVWHEASDDIFTRGYILTAGGNLRAELDIDQDGKGEFLTYEQDGGQKIVYLFEASGDNNYEIIWQHQFSDGVTGLVGGERGIMVTDIDNDGRQEIVVIVDSEKPGTANGFNAGHIFEWDGRDINGASEIGLSQTPTATFDPPRDAAGRVALENNSLAMDLDNDGNIELILTHRGGNGKLLSIIQLTSTDLAANGVTMTVEFDENFADTDVTHFLAKNTGFGITDVDKDGLKEIIMFDDNTGFVRVYEGTGANSYAFVKEWQPNPSGWTEFTTVKSQIPEADFDNNGVMELYLSDNKGNSWIITPNGNVTSMFDDANWTLLHDWKVGNVYNEGGEIRGSLIGDVDRDGKPDIYLAGNNFGSILDIEYDGGDVTVGSNYSYFVTAIDANDDVDGGHFARPANIQLTDMDGDGHLEILAIVPWTGANPVDNLEGLYVFEHPAGVSDNPFDLDGFTLFFSPNATAGYDVNRIPFSFDTVLGSNVFAGDDTNHEFNITSGFSFPFFGTNWTNIWVRSNGNVTFGDISNTIFFDPMDFELELPMIAAFFTDLDPSTGGGVFFKEEATKFTVTWYIIPEFEVLNSNTIQLVLFNSGSFQITYNGVDIVTPDNGSLTVGFNSGRTNPLKQSVDFTNVSINGGSNDILFEFFGPQEPTISLSPSPLNFGDVQVGSSGQIVLSISNSGGAALDISNITSSNSQFTVASPTSFQVAAGASINKTVTFAPTTTGLKSGTLTVTSNASNLPSATVDLSGTGTVAQLSEFKITASDGAIDDQFGRSVSISGDYAVVGARLNDDNGLSSGSAYVFKRSGTSWAEEAKLLPFDGAGSDLFGGSVSISGDYAVVGARLNDDNGNASGSAYVFKRTGTSWVEEAKLLPSDGAANDLFGGSVSISGDYAVVGAFTDDNGLSSGSAYVFKRTGTSWAEEAKLLPSDGAGSDFFGISVSISGDLAIVGAYADDDNGLSSGSAYVFKRTGTSWAEEAKLLPSDGAGSDFFGISVSISGDLAIVGAYADDDNGLSSGSAYVFKRTGTSWAEEAKLLPVDGAGSDLFGFSVSISGDLAIVGAYANDDNGTDAGSAYVFKRTGTSWAEEAKLLPVDGAAIDQFGFSVSISGDYAVVGAVGDDDNGDGSGSAYLYNVFTASPTASISLSPSPLNFGDVEVGSSGQIVLSISNSGNTALDVTNITSSNSQFTVASPTSFQ
ncbi:choice-of-anchor D domain-containing protein, partial [Candidatus Marinimicrobia bacterium MT.SAG.3]